MKKLSILLMLTALAVPAFGQTVACEDCDHELSVYYGTGGFIAKVSGDADMVNWVAQCGRITTSGELEPNDDGIVDMSFNAGNALDCYEEDPKDRRFWLGPVMDGGWFFVHVDRENAAIGNLVRTEVVDAEVGAVELVTTSRVTMMPGRGATLIKDTMSDRVGLVPTMVPELPMEVAETDPCGFSGSGSNARVRNTDCKMGDGTASFRVQGPLDVFTGDRDPITTGMQIVRPHVANTSITLTYDLWGDGSGHFNHNADGNARLGWKGGPAFTTSMRPTYSTSLGVQTAISDTSSDQTSVTAAGLGYMQSEGADTGSVLTLTITPNENYCDPAATPAKAYPVNVTVAAMPTDTPEQRGQVTPPIAVNAAGAAATHMITVVCPTASTNQGQELVPENPFPVE